MGKKPNSGKYQLRFELLWSQLLLLDAHRAGELCPGLVSGVIGCSERYARELIDMKLGRRLKEIESGLKVA